MTFVSTRYFGPHVPGAPTCEGAVVAAWKRALVLGSQGRARGWVVSVFLVLVGPQDGVEPLRVAMCVLGAGL